jgi:hemerythrin-like domain-containing protein
VRHSLDHRRAGWREHDALTPPSRTTAIRLTRQAARSVYSSTQRENTVDAIQLLKSEHKEVKELLVELTETTSRAVKRRAELIATIQTKLSAHVAIEEEIFYPAYRDAGGKEQEKMYYEALEEHRAAKDLVLGDLFKTEPDSEKFSGRAKVLKELIEHHIEEEEQEMLKQAKELLDKDQLRSLGEAMAERKKELVAEAKKQQAA